MENKSGIQPLSVNVLVKPLVVNEKSPGGIIFAQQAVENEQMAQTYAELVAVGGNAFETWDDPKPEVGDMVYVTRWAGVRGLLGVDGEKYQMCNERDVTAIVTELPETLELVGQRVGLGRQ